MDDRSSQIFGCFVGVLLTIIVSQILFHFFNFSILVEYIIMGVIALIFCVFGILFARLIGKKAPSATASVPVSTPPQPPTTQKT